ncbi:hypothetical protein M573_127012 [Prevotella intermedia ZT]|uniref:Uncharacterized protein n=1 Tax=Prevotella intermedia ZT TaxID=1347790 RepID=A0AAP0YSW2_PREIN|nr:hypothetical protein M573_127012 [Prevotella intermedia ZT]
MPERINLFRQSKTICLPPAIYQLPEIRLAQFSFYQKSEKTTIGRIKKVVFY